MNKNTDTAQRIAIFGSSGQVGSSVAFYLKQYTGIVPVCFIRSEYSRPFFDLLGIESQLIDNDTPAILSEKLKPFPMVLDFTFPMGQSFEISQKIRENTKRMISSMPKGAKYIYMSSIMAFGMPDDYGKVKPYLFPRAIYGSIKRNAEKNVKKYGAQYKIQVYIFRLGQVHGFLQSVNASFHQQLRSFPELSLNGDPRDLTNTLFIGTLGDAIIQCLLDKMKPGLYSLVSNPQWTLEQLYQYYMTYYDRNNNLVFVPSRPQSLTTSLKGKGIRFLKKLRPLIEIYFLAYFGRLSVRIKGKYRIMEAKKRPDTSFLPYADYHILGKCPLPFFKEQTASPADMLKLEKEMEAHYSRVLHTSSYAS